jgi:hypothetical protein
MTSLGPRPTVKAAELYELQELKYTTQLRERLFDIDRCSV